jgi:hypothetical protein
MLKIPFDKMTVIVYRDAGGSDCTNGGVTSQHARMVLYGSQQAWEQDPKREDVGDKALIVVERELRGQGTYYHARPAAFRQGEGMFGGNFVYTSGSPYFENFDGRPIAVHDRIE